MNQVIETTTKTIKCPNCQMEVSWTYPKTEKRPVAYGKCKFCSTLYRASKTKTIEVIPATSKQYIIHRPMEGMTKETNKECITDYKSNYIPPQYP